MKFVKEQNGNIRVTDDSGNNLDLIQDIGSRVAATNLGESVSVTQNGFEILRFETADVTATQVLPAAEIAFAGTTSDLIQILTDSFFIIPTGGGGGEINTASNVGSGVGVFKQKVGVDLELKSLIGGVGIDIVENTNDLTFNFNTEALEIGNWNFITQKDDFPTPVAGVITLPADETWVIAGDIDLQGDRIVMAGVTTIIGGSSETSYLTSTGLGAGVALITTEWTLAMQFLTFRDVDTCFSIDGNTNPPLALDWTGVNFLNIPNIGTVNTCDNFIYTKGAFLSSKNLLFDGTHGTIAFNNSLLQGDGAAGDIVKVLSTATIIRRFRINYSPVIASGLTNGINIDPLATIPDESFVLDTVSFAGGSTYLPGIGTASNKALFIRCTGITNTAVNGQMYMQNNGTATTVLATNTFYKVAGTTTASPDNSKYLHSNNRLTNDATISRDYLIQCNLSFSSGNNNVCEFGFFDSKLGAVRTPSRTKSTANSAGRAENVSFFCVVTHSQGDYIEIHAANTSSTNNITVTDMNVVITEIR